MINPSPECIQRLREEVESIVKEQGWTKAYMLKLDSFLRESQRISGGATGEDRLVLNDLLANSHLQFRWHARL